MIPEEIARDIESMGYIKCEPRVVRPSYYKLSDGTIISALITIDYLTPNTSSPNEFGMNASTKIAVFVSKENRKLQNFQPYQQSELQSGVIDDDVDNDALSEAFSVYDLSNGLEAMRN